MSWVGTTFSVVWCMMPNIFENYSERLCGELALKHKSQNRLNVFMVHTGYSFMSVTGKDTALAWLMPTKTAMQRITLAHSRLNLCGSPRWWSKQGYKRPTTAEERENISALNNSNSSKTRGKNNNHIWCLNLICIVWLLFRTQVDNFCFSH